MSAFESDMSSVRVVPVFESDSDTDQSYNADIHSPSNDMVVDSDDLLNDVEAEKDDGDIAIINPEDELVPRADDCMASLATQIAQLADPLASRGYERACPSSAFRTTSYPRDTSTQLANR